MLSLTGYGKGIVELDGRKITVEIKSVNHRFLDLSFKIPKLFLFCEDSLRKSISSVLNRGHIDCFVTYEDNRGDKTTLAVDYSLADALIATSKELSEKYGVENDFSVTALMRYPDVLSAQKTEEDENELKELVLSALQEALNKLKAMREREGLAMKNDILSRLTIMSELLSSIKERAPLVVEDYRNKLKIRMEEALSEVEVDEARLLNEVCFFTDKCNIDEEMTRLSQHIKAFYADSELNEPVGRKLDFLVQEMNREINTIGSKASDLQITRNVVALKNELEKIREQVQNIE